MLIDSTFNHIVPPTFQRVFCAFYFDNKVDANVDQHLISHILSQHFNEYSVPFISITK